MELGGSSNSAASIASLRHWRERHPEPLIVVWDNSPAHQGDPIRAYLTAPGSNPRRVNPPSYSSDFNVDEVTWGWAGKEATANLCLGSRAAVQETVGDFFCPPFQPSGRIKTALPNHTASTSTTAHGPLPSRRRPPSKCRFHLGLQFRQKTAGRHHAGRARPAPPRSQDTSGQM